MGKKCRTDKFFWTEAGHFKTLKYKKYESPKNIFDVYYETNNLELVCYIYTYTVKVISNFWQKIIIL